MWCIQMLLQLWHAPRILQLLDGVWNSVRRKVKLPTHKRNLWTYFSFTTLTLLIYFANKLSPPLPGSIPGTNSFKVWKFYFKTLLGTKKFPWQFDYSVCLLRVFPSSHQNNGVLYWKRETQRRDCAREMKSRLANRNIYVTKPLMNLCLTTFLATGVFYLTRW